MAAVAPRPDPAEFVRVCRAGEVEDGVPKAFSVAGSEDPRRVLVRVGGELRALSGICPHQGGDLSEGIVEGSVLWCPVHSSGFDCRTGAVVHPPAPGPLRTYEVALDGDDVYVRA